MEHNKHGEGQKKRNTKKRLKKLPDLQPTDIGVSSAKVGNLSNVMELRKRPEIITRN